MNQEESNKCIFGAYRHALLQKDIELLINHQGHGTPCPYGMLEHVFSKHVKAFVNDGDEIDFIPPVAGGVDG